MNDLIDIKIVQFLYLIHYCQLTTEWCIHYSIMVQKEDRQSIIYSEKVRMKWKLSTIFCATYSSFFFMFLCLKHLSIMYSLKIHTLWHWVSLYIFLIFYHAQFLISVVYKLNYINNFKKSLKFLRILSSKFNVTYTQYDT